MSINYPLFVDELINKFKLKVLSNENQIKKIQITCSSLSRCAFELTGEIVYKSLIAITYFGNKESLYLDKFDEETIKNKIKVILKMTPPIILIGPNFKYTNLIVDLSKDTKIPIVETQHNFQILNLIIGNWIQEKLATYELTHGSLVSVFGMGTLITGRSGIGKSEVVVELIKKGHIFIGDDSIMITRIGKRIFGKPNDLTKNFIEIRGLGVLNFQHVFGIDKQIKSSRINVICELVDMDELDKYSCQFERLGNKITYNNILGVDIPYYRIPVSQGRNISELIETAITDLKLKKQGYFSAEEFIQQISKKKEKK
ncbi:MAG: HPr(Ser) kinase/phosphatase [Ureaplasma sp.]|nr:HPr(Ser) kinase/phosphatase [Ureaplasma sp.]